MEYFILKNYVVVVKILVLANEIEDQDINISDLVSSIVVQRETDKVQIVGNGVILVLKHLKVHRNYLAVQLMRYLVTGRGKIMLHISSVIFSLFDCLQMVDYVLDTRDLAASYYKRGAN